MTSLLTATNFSTFDLDLKAVRCYDAECDPYYCFVDINSGAVFINSDDRDSSNIPDIHDNIELIGVWNNLDQTHVILTEDVIKWAENYCIPIHQDAWPYPKPLSHLRKMNAYEQRKISAINRKTFLVYPRVQLF